MGEPHFYRLQGPRPLADYDNAQRDVNHIHTARRDPGNDLGDDVPARHHARSTPSDSYRPEKIPGASPICPERTCNPSILSSAFNARAKIARTSARSET